MTFKLLNSVGYIGQLIGYDKDNDTDGILDYRYLGMVIKANKKLSLISQEEIRIVYGNGLS
jgi:hypothetical protein